MALVFVFKDGRNGNCHNVQLGPVCRNRKQCLAVPRKPKKKSFARCGEEAICWLAPNRADPWRWSPSIPNLLGGGDIVLDRFSGSGTNDDRRRAHRPARCGLELDPGLSIRCPPWQALTGLAAPRHAAEPAAALTILAREAEVSNAA